MKLKEITLIGLIISLIVPDTIAQIPPNTVVFKIRKKQNPQEIKVEEKKDEVIVKEPVFFTVEENASFQGGDVNTFRLWVQRNIVYPIVASDARISGKVIVQFAVNFNGKVVEARVVRGAHPELNKEVIRVVMSSPPWTPGKQGGKPVKQQFTIQIVFRLQ